jgi:hypothetical protein
MKDKKKEDLHTNLQEQYQKINTVIKQLHDSSLSEATIKDLARTLFLS